MDTPKKTALRGEILPVSRGSTDPTNKPLSKAAARAYGRDLSGGLVKIKL